MTPDEFKRLAADYRSLRAPSSVDAQVRAAQARHVARTPAPGGRRSRNLRPVLALAAGVVAAAVVALWIMPARAPTRTAEAPAAKPRISTAIPSVSSLAVPRPRIDPAAVRPPRFSTLRTPPRPRISKPSKEKRHVQS